MSGLPRRKMKLEQFFKTKIHKAKNDVSSNNTSTTPVGVNNPPSLDGVLSEGTSPNIVNAPPSCALSGPVLAANQSDNSCPHVEEISSPDFIPPFVARPFEAPPEYNYVGKRLPPWGGRPKAIRTSDVPTTAQNGNVRSPPLDTGEVNVDTILKRFDSVVKKSTSPPNAQGQAQHGQDATKVRPGCLPGTVHVGTPNKRPPHQSQPIHFRDPATYVALNIEELRDEARLRGLLWSQYKTKDDLAKALVHHDDQFHNAMWRHENRTVAELRDTAIRRNIALDQSKYYDWLTLSKKIAEHEAREAMWSFDATMEAQHVENSKADVRQLQSGKTRKSKRKAEDEAPEPASRTKAQTSGSSRKEVRKEGEESGSTQKTSTRKAPAKSSSSTAKAAIVNSTVTGTDAQPKRKRARLSDHNDDDEQELLAMLAEEKKKAQAGIARPKPKESTETQKRVEPPKKKPLVQSSQQKQVAEKSTPKPPKASDAPSKRASPRPGETSKSFAPSRFPHESSSNEQKARAPKGKRNAPAAGMKGVATILRKRKSEWDEEDDFVVRDEHEREMKRRVMPRMLAR